LDETTATIKTLDESLKTASDGANADLRDIHQILSDPSLTASQQEALGILTDIHGTTEQVQAASKNLPDIAASIDKMAKTSSKFSKAYWLARIASLFGFLIP
jgi:hypothetical protein